VRTAVVGWKDRGRADLTRPLSVGLRRAAMAALEGAELGGAELEGAELEGAQLGGAALEGPALEDSALQDSALVPCRRSAAAPRGHGPDRLPATGTVLVPVPSSARSRRARGHDPVRDLARVTASGLRRRGCPVMVLPVLRQARWVADQAGLTAADRRSNLAGALVVRPGWQARLPGRQVLLVDDVVTTGATLTEAHRVLLNTGARVLAAATVAATARRGPHGK
jgi:hypothetical protein